MANIVGALKGLLVEIKQCNNPEYCQLVFNFPVEFQGTVFPIEKQTQPQNTKILVSSKQRPDLTSLQLHKVYALTIGFFTRQPNTKNDVNYPASMGMNILEAKLIG